MADYDIVADDWNIRDHIEYMGCTEESPNKYYVLMDKTGVPILTTGNLEEAIREANRRDITMHHWIVALPKRGVVMGTITLSK